MNVTTGRRGAGIAVVLGVGGDYGLQICTLATLLLTVAIGGTGNLLCLVQCRLCDVGAIHGGSMRGRGGGARAACSDVAARALACTLRPGLCRHNAGHESRGDDEMQVRVANSKLPLAGSRERESDLASNWWALVERAWGWLAPAGLCTALCSLWTQPLLPGGACMQLLRPLKICPAHATGR